MTLSGESNDRAGATRLRDALNQPDALTHDEAETLIALLVEAEAIEEDVDDDPTFAPLFAHLDHCQRCLALYEAVSEDYAAALAEQTSRPPRALPIATAVVPPRRSFEFVVRAPRPDRRMAIREEATPYGTTNPRDAFADVDWQTDEDATTLVVRVLPPFDASAWRIEARAEGYTDHAHTDARGVATFRAVPTDLPITLAAHEQE